MLTNTQSKDEEKKEELKKEELSIAIESDATVG
jgi:hypothetical protein